jgi:hypothetical protein
MAFRFLLNKFNKMFLTINANSVTIVNIFTRKNRQHENRPFF